MCAHDAGATAEDHPYGEPVILGSRSGAWEKLSPGRFLAVALVVVPALIVLSVLGIAYHEGILGIDFEQTLLPAARAVAAGDSPYPGYGYPPLVAFVLVPLTVVPGPNIVFAVLLAAAVPASLWFLGVRDWRCYGAVFLWSPVWAAIQTENVTILLLLGTAVCWHMRERPLPAAVAGGLAIAAKILCWPLLVWLAAMGRVRAAVGAAAVAVGVTVGLWATLGFSGLVDYPSNLNGLGHQVSAESYTVKVVLIDAGLGAGVARLGWILVALAVVAASFWLGRRGDDRRSFALAAFAMIAASPIVWLHSFAFLLAPVAVLRPRLSAVWFVPLGFALVPGTGNGRPWQTALALGLAAATMVAALAPSSARPASGPVSLRSGSPDHDHSLALIQRAASGCAEQDRGAAASLGRVEHDDRVAACGAQPSRPHRLEAARARRAPRSVSSSKRMS